MCERHLRTATVGRGGEAQAAERREQRKWRCDRLELKPCIHLVVLDLHDRDNGAAKAHQGLFKPRPVAKWASGEESDLRSWDPESNVGEVGPKTKHLVDRPMDDDSSRRLDHDDHLPSPDGLDVKGIYGAAPKPTAHSTCVRVEYALSTITSSTLRRREHPRSKGEVRKEAVEDLYDSIVRESSKEQQLNAANTKS